MQRRTNQVAMISSPTADTPISVGLQSAWNADRTLLPCDETCIEVRVVCYSEVCHIFGCAPAPHITGIRALKYPLLAGLIPIHILEIDNVLHAVRQRNLSTGDGS